MGKRVAKGRIGSFEDRWVNLRARLIRRFHDDGGWADGLDLLDGLFVDIDARRVVFVGVVFGDGLVLGVYIYIYTYIHTYIHTNALPLTLARPSRLPLPDRHDLTLPQHPPRIRLRPAPTRRVVIEQHVPRARVLQGGLPAGRLGVLRVVRPDRGCDADEAVDRADHFRNLVRVLLGAGLRFGFRRVDVGLQARIAFEVGGDGGEGWLAWGGEGV